MFIVHGHPAVEVEPGKCPFHHPPLGFYHKAFHTFVPLRDLETEIRFFNGIPKGAPVRLVPHYFLKPRHCFLKPVEKAQPSRTVVDIGGMDSCLPDPAEHVHDHVPFAAVDPFVPVRATVLEYHRGQLNTLGINESEARRGLPLNLFAFQHVEGQVGEIKVDEEAGDEALGQGGLGQVGEGG